MFKLKFKRKTQHAGPQFSGEYPEFSDNEYANGYDPYTGEYYQEISHPQGYECLICNSPITGSHLVVLTRHTEYYLHPSCILSGFALVLNGFNLLIKLFVTRKEGRNKHEQPD